MDRSKQEYWSNQIYSQEQTGQSARGYCRDNSLSYQSFIYWKRKLHNDHADTMPLVKINSSSDLISTGHTLDTNSGIEIVISESLRLRLKTDYHAPTLHRLLSDFGVTI